MKNTLRYILFILLFSLLAGSCAKISTPSGGIRDRIPPVVIKTIPAYGARNFHGSRVEIFFNEYVVLDKINDKFLVSPPMKKKPEVTIKGKSVVVEYEDKLKDSTTYTFNFQDAIRDLNEGNVLNNYEFVFSTGSVLDSLSVTGNVYNAFTLDPPERAQLLLYSNLDDSAVVRDFPDYMSMTDLNGYFRINNLRPGKYRLYALNDGNNSKTYDRSEEEFAFMDTVINVTPEKNYMPMVKDTTSMSNALIKVGVQAGQKKVTAQNVKPPPKKGVFQLYSFVALKKQHYLESTSRDMKYRLNYILSLPPDTMNFNFSIPGEGKGKYIIEKSLNRDTIQVWLTDSVLYSQPAVTSIISYPFTDTLGFTSYKTDTIIMRFTEPRQGRSRTITKKPLVLGSDIRGGTLKPGQTIFFNIPTPFRKPDTSLIRLYQLVDANREKVPYVLFPDSLKLNEYRLKAPLEAGNQYLFIADSSSFGDIFNETIDSTAFKFSVRKADSYSKLILDIKNCNTPCIIQLLDKGEKLIQQKYINADGKVIFDLLDPGIYRPKVIYDLNNDGKWTTGDFLSGRQPEPVSYYKNQIELKVGWDLVQDWDLSVRQFKEDKMRVIPQKKK
jgi:uncharacterized protein (DUF2141 family)